MGGKPLPSMRAEMKKKKPKPARYFGRRALKRLSMPVRPTLTQPKTTENNPLGIYDTSTVLYIQGRRAEEKEPEPVLVEEDEKKRMTAQFNEKLRDNPHDVQLWLSFVKFQDTARFVSSVSEPSAKNLSQQRALVERKMSILEKAIEQNPKSEALVTARLHLAAEFKEASALQQDWRNTLFVHPASIRLWKRYLHFTQSYFEGFTVQQALKAYANCLQKLIKMQHPSFSAHQRPVNLEEQLIGEIRIPLGNPFVNRLQF